jgi:YD repeat-containing protein
MNVLPPPMREPVQWPGSGQIYLMPLGRPTTYSFDGLPEYYRQRFGLEVKVLPWVPLNPSVEDPLRHQVVAEKLLELMRRSQPELSEDPNAFLIGVSEMDMYIAAYDWEYAFNRRQEGRFAVVSTARMGSVSIPEASNPETLQVQLRKMLTKNIGLLYYQLPLSADPTSVLYGNIDSSSDIDRMGEDFIGTAGVWKPMPVGGDPCITITQRAGKSPTWRFDCSHLPPADTKSQSFEVDISLGLFVQRQTDFYIDEPFPLVLARMYRPQDKWCRAFGIGTNHSFDIFLFGDAQNFSYVDLILEDGGRVHYKRISPGTGYAAAEFATEDNFDSPFSSSGIRWNGNGWDLQREDGWTFVFPHGADARRAQQAALIGMHDSNGHSFKMVRDARGNLLKVATPNGNLIDFEYDSAERVTRAKDNRGRYVTYQYDPSGRLVLVEDSSGRVERYSYDPKDQMLTVEDGAGQVLLTNEYDAEGNVARQTLADGRVLAYRYTRASNDELMEAEFTDPRGYVTQFRYGPSGYTQSLPQLPAN